MQISYKCSTCGVRLQVDGEDVGSEVECPECHGMTKIPVTGPGPGVTFGGFRIKELLGKGGMGEVYLARQLSMDRYVALKILPSEFTAREDFVKRFLNEVRMAARLEHPNIVTAYEAGEDSGIYYLATAYVDGMSLDEVLEEQGAMAEDAALGIIRKVASALAYAWSKHRVLHRDVKPSNIMLDQEGEPQLTDLGLSKSLDEVTGMTLSGMVLGTPNYMSPEQAEGKADIDFHVDMYSLGATLYHMVTGQVPFESSSVIEVLRKQVTEALPDPRKFNPELSEGCVSLMEVMLAKDVKKRHADWEALMADIDRTLAGKDPGQAPLQPGESLLLRAGGVHTPEHKKIVLGRSTVESMHHRDPPEKTPEERGRRTRMAVLAAVIVLVVVVGGAVLVTMQKSQEAEKRAAAVARDKEKLQEQELQARKAREEEKRLALQKQLSEASQYTEQHPADMADSFRR